MASYLKERQVKRGLWRGSEAKKKSNYSDAASLLNGLLTDSAQVGILTSGPASVLSPFSHFQMLLVSRRRKTLCLST